MNKNDNQQLAIQQLAIILNYNAHVEHQHFHSPRQRSKVAEASDKVPNRKESGKTEQLNYFAPKKNLQELVLEDWFEGVCVEKKTYSKVWRAKLVSDLMASEYGAYIAKLWSQKDKRLTIKGQFVGTLVGAGVLKGSNLAIARTILDISHNTRDEDEKKEANTFAKYMGQGKGEPYAAWVQDYVEKTVQKRQIG